MNGQRFGTKISGKNGKTLKRVFWAPKTLVGSQCIEDSIFFGGCDFYNDVDPHGMQSYKTLVIAYW